MDESPHPREPESQAPGPAKTDQGKRHPYRQLARWMHLGFVLPASVVVGLLIGAALDRWLGTTWMTIAGVILGSIAGFVELIRAVVEASKE